MTAGSFGSLWEQRQVQSCIGPRNVSRPYLQGDSTSSSSNVSSMATSKTKKARGVSFTDSASVAGVRVCARGLLPASVPQAPTCTRFG